MKWLSSLRILLVVIVIVLLTHTSSAKHKPSSHHKKGKKSHGAIHKSEAKEDMMKKSGPNEPKSNIKVHKSEAKEDTMIKSGPNLKSKIKIHKSEAKEDTIKSALKKLKSKNKSRKTKSKEHWMNKSAHSKHKSKNKSHKSKSKEHWMNKSAQTKHKSKTKSHKSKSKEDKMKKFVREQLMKVRGNSHGHKGKGKPLNRFPNPYTQCEINTAIVCENKDIMMLKCPSGSVIKVIDANFGRTQPDDEVCPYSSYHRDETDCYSTDANIKVRHRCDNMKTCALRASTRYFGDPCRGTYKYLEVEYICVIKQDYGKGWGRGFRKGRGKKNRKSPSEEICIAPCPDHCSNGEECLVEKQPDGSYETVCACDTTNPECGPCKNPAGLTCTASGDPHYKTFDGKMLHFQGTCRYLLSGTVENTTETEFQVLVENEHRDSNAKVSYTKTVIVLVYGHQIVLRTGGVVLVNGVIVTLPYNGISGVVIEFGSRQKVILETDFGLIVDYDGKHIASVTLPQNYCSQVEGICGNMNGEQMDDCVTKEGKDVCKDRDMYTKIGNSWKVYSDDIESCEDPDSDIDLPDGMPDECTILVDDPDSALIQCIGELPDSAKNFLDDCSFDVIAAGDNGKHRQEAACGVIESFVEFCEIVLETIVRDWRDDASCPISCPDGFVFSKSATGCPASCEDLFAPDTCDLPDIEGCVCEEGKVLDGEDCVFKEQCGCVDDSGNHHKQGDMWLSEDCTEEYSCGPGGITTTPHACEDDQYCGVLGGTRQCVDEEPLPDSPCDTEGGYLKCLTCTNETSYIGCALNGEWVTCDGDDDICLEEIASVPFSNKGIQITRRCVSKPQCKALIHQQGGVCSRRCRLPMCRACHYGYSRCAVDCDFGPWKPEGKCSAPCGPGTQNLIRMPNSPPAKNGGKPCGNSPTKQVPCFEKECSVDGGWCPYEDWSPCSKECGPGRRARRRECMCPEPEKGGKPCSGPPVQIEPCRGTNCPVDGEWSTWSNFGECKGICGIGVKTRHRTCTDPAPSVDPPGRNCQGRDWDIMKCKLAPCMKPVNGMWGSWCDFGECSASCGSGIETRTRQCDSPAPQDGGKPCVGSSTDDQPCFAGPCPIDEPYPCDEGSYLQCFTCQNQPGDAACQANGNWQSCNGPDQICTKRVVSRNSMERVFRGCITRSACQGQQRNGVCFQLGPMKACVTCSYGVENEEHRCPVNGGWCDWGDFGDCSVDCGRGMKIQSRNCTCPEPQNGGNDCMGKKTNSMPCDAGCCPVDGGWGPFKGWSPCSATCGVGKQVNRRMCNNPKPECGGAECQDDADGGAMKMRECDAGECPVKEPNPCPEDRSALQCWRCENQTSEADCASNGHFETCSDDDPICITRVTFFGSSKSISRGCEERPACYAAQASNGGVCVTNGGQRQCVLCNFRMSRCVEPPPYPCPSDENLWCFTCEATSIEECQENGSFELCNGAEQDMCYYNKVVDSFGMLTSVSLGCKPRSECEDCEIDLGEVCEEDNSGAVTCERCGFKPGKFQCKKAPGSSRSSLKIWSSLCAMLSLSARLSLSVMLPANETVKPAKYCSRIRRKG